uniref:Putative isomerase YddE n=1 Tax=Leptospirillum ferriphilum TaxID=178606 RepID=A0A2I2MFX1_9BACT|nr:PhzF family phenazine biosynthesis isomerase [Leptospirillum ferriphilum]
MTLKLFQIDAFADHVFAGNPAAGLPLESWLPDALLQSIASENNLSETVFFVPAESGFHLRWFTPVCEVDLCGHATLAAAHVLFRHLAYPVNSLVFHTRSGALEVEEKDGLIVMDFPASRSKPCPPPDELVQAVGKVPVEVWAGSLISPFTKAPTIFALWCPTTRSCVLWICRGSRPWLREDRRKKEWISSAATSPRRSGSPKIRSQAPPTWGTVPISGLSPPAASPC